MKSLESRRKWLILMASLFVNGLAMAQTPPAQPQINIRGNVYGGGNLGKVSQNTTVTMHEADFVVKGR